MIISCYVFKKKFRKLFGTFLLSSSQRRTWNGLISMVWKGGHNVKCIRKFTCSSGSQPASWKYSLSWGGGRVLHIWYIYLKKKSSSLHIVMSVVVCTIYFHKIWDFLTKLRLYSKLTYHCKFCYGFQVHCSELKV